MSIPLLSANQISAVDKHTIVHQPIESIKLMERAGMMCTNWITARFDTSRHVVIFCGIGNNGGDGLVIARLLAQAGYQLDCYIVQPRGERSADFNTNLARLQAIGITVSVIDDNTAPPKLSKDDLVIDAIFGAGLNRAIIGFIARLTAHINYSDALVIAVDIPSGIFCTNNTNDNRTSAIRAQYTLSIQLPKLAFMLAENADFIGQWHTLNIGLDQDFILAQPTQYYLLDQYDFPHRYKKRDKFSHKGNYGRAMIIAGKRGSIGAGILAARACLRSGAGVLFVSVPRCGYHIIQSTVPEAMIMDNQGKDFLTDNWQAMFASYALGIGPGIGTHAQTSAYLRAILQSQPERLVLDADAINLLSADPKLLAMLPRNTILTPHPKEFARLMGQPLNDTDRLTRQQDFANKYHCYLIVKGAHTTIACPDGMVYFNNTGNPGMATAGSGDVLTGIITGLLAQGYTAKQSALSGVYAHGLAGDLAEEKRGETALIASDIIDHLGDAWLS